MSGGFTMHGQGVPHDRFLNTIEARSTVLPIEDEAIVVAFRRYTLLPLDDCLYMRAANGDAPKSGDEQEPS